MFLEDFARAFLLGIYPTYSLYISCSAGIYVCISNCYLNGHGVSFSLLIVEMFFSHCLIYWHSGVASLNKVTGHNVGLPSG